MAPQLDIQKESPVFLASITNIFHQSVQRSTCSTQSLTPYCHSHFLIFGILPPWFLKKKKWAQGPLFDHNEHKQACFSSGNNGLMTREVCWTLTPFTTTPLSTWCLIASTQLRICKASLHVISGTHKDTQRLYRVTWMMITINPSSASLLASWRTVGSLEPCLCASNPGSVPSRVLKQHITSVNAQCFFLKWIHPVRCDKSCCQR